MYEKWLIHILQSANHLVIITTIPHNAGLYNRCWDYYYLIFVSKLLNKTHSAAKSTCQMKNNNFINQGDRAGSVILTQFCFVNIYSMIFYAEWSHIPYKGYSLLTNQSGNYCRLGIKRVEHTYWWLIYDCRKWVSMWYSDIWNNV